MTDRGKRVLVCGGRNYADRARVYKVLDELRPSVVIHGAARGADTLAANWAYTRGVEQLPFPADWEAHGRGAGPRRNAKMLAEGKPDLVVAFPGGNGTADMVARSRRAGVQVREEE